MFPTPSPPQLELHHQKSSLEYMERGKIIIKTPSSFHILESEPLDKRIFCKRLFLYEYFIYIESGSIIPWPVLLLSPRTCSGVRRGKAWVSCQIPRGPSHDWVFKFSWPNVQKQPVDAWAVVSSCYLEKELDPQPQPIKLRPLEQGH